MSFINFTALYREQILMAACHSASQITQSPALYPQDCKIIYILDKSSMISVKAMIFIVGYHRK